MRSQTVNPCALSIIVIKRCWTLTGPPRRQYTLCPSVFPACFSHDITKGGRKEVSIYHTLTPTTLRCASAERCQNDAHLLLACLRVQKTEPKIGIAIRNGARNPSPPPSCVVMSQVSNERKYVRTYV